MNLQQLFLHPQHDAYQEPKHQENHVAARSSSKYVGTALQEELYDRQLDDLWHALHQHSCRGKQKKDNSLNLLEN